MNFYDMSFVEFSLVITAAVWLGNFLWGLASLIVGSILSIIWSILSWIWGLIKGFFGLFIEWEEDVHLENEETTEEEDL